MPDFSTRSTQIEVMDDLTCGGEVIDQTLRELEFINTWLGGNHVTINGLTKLLKNQVYANEIVIADLGCGGGDMLRLIHNWARKNKYQVKLIGIDANPNIIRFAESHMKQYPNMKFLSINIFSEEFRKMKFDVVLGTLFYHHFDNQQLSAFFKELKNRVAIGFVVNDIHRHPLAYYSIQWLTRIFSKSSMVISDAPLSVLRAFRKNELIEILRKAELQNFSIQWKWAFRWQVVVRTNV